ncbi:MAG: RnfABCDGE type electron transport complex subunit B [Dysgonamonadaceae bacterium]|jgi:Na+-translocating ferredoxin:NAD+ oxidoreductase RNF subunit RnfB|nr:RnfABCDGE type electron transport complex subunit B [Dysgonamonadaceae bacterium]
MDFILPAVLSLGLISIISAIVLYIVSKKFEVREDPRIAEIQAILPAANCGGCGYPGCSGFAAACVAASSLDGLLCPVGGAATMTRLAGILGKTVERSDPRIAVLHCNGRCEKRPRLNRYDGLSVCAAASLLYGGETGCSYGCLGMGDCVAVCNFNAIRIHPETLLPEIDEARCTACGACAKACPKQLIRMLKKGPDSHRVYVACMNKEKGAVARKACAAACIACSKCVKICVSQAITLENNLARIDEEKCILCGQCVAECPTSAIVEHIKNKIESC